MSTTQNEIADYEKQIAALKAKLDQAKAREQEREAELEAIAKAEGLARTKVTERLYEAFGIEEEFSHRRQVGKAMADVSTDKDGALRAERALKVIEALAKTDVLKNDLVAEAVREQEAERQQRKADRDAEAAKKKGRSKKTNDKPADTKPDVTPPASTTASEPVKKPGFMQRQPQPA